MKSLLARLLKDKSGATAIEYGLIISVISMGIISGASSIGKNVSGTFDKVSGNVNTTK